MGPVCANWKGLELLLPLPTCGLMSTSKDHEATPSLAGGARKGHARKVMSPPTDSFISERDPPKNSLFWRNRALFPVASRSNPRCSKAQIASYLAQIRRFLALTAWASSTSTTGSRRFWACFFGQWLEKGRGCPWHACGTIGWNNTMTYPWEESNLYISPYPWIWRAIPTPAGIAVAQWQGKGMPGRSCHLPQIPLFLKETRQKTAYFGKIGRFSPSPLEAIHAAAKLKLRAIWPK